MNNRIALQELKGEMSKLLISEPTLWRWRFFITRGHPSQEFSVGDYKKEFTPFFDDAARWALNERPPSLDWPASPFDGSAQRLYSSDWKKVGRTWRRIRAATLLDCSYIQTGCAFRSTPEDERDTIGGGRTGAGLFVSLRNEEASWAQRSLASDIFYVTEAQCIEAELTEGIEPAKAKILAADLFGREPDDIGLFTIASGFFGTVDDASLESEIVLWETGATPKVNEDRNIFFFRLMPYLMLARTKWRSLSRTYDAEISPEAHVDERKLQQHLKVMAEQQRNLKKLEESLLTISRLQVSFARNLNKCEESLITIDTNARTIERTVRHRMFATDRDQIDQMLIEPLRFTRDRIEIDIRYLSATDRQVNGTIEGTKIMAELRARRLETALTILLGGFVILELFHVFPELHEEFDSLYISPLERLGVCVVLFAALIICVRLWVLWQSRRRDRQSPWGWVRSVIFGKKTGGAASV
jgi:hypothetical protein